MCDPVVPFCRSRAGLKGAGGSETKRGTCGKAEARKSSSPCCSCGQEEAAAEMHHRETDR